MHFSIIIIPLLFYVTSSSQSTPDRAHSQQQFVPTANRQLPYLLKDYHYYNNNYTNAEVCNSRTEKEDQQRQRGPDVDKYSGFAPSDVITQQYIDERSNNLERVLKRDSSIDERLANSVHSVYSGGVLNVDYFKFNSGNIGQDLKNEQLAAGDQVEEAACGRHLREMLSQLDELQEMLRERRHDDSSGHLSHRSLEERHIRLARALEAFGHYDGGLLSGKTHLFGSYDQCLNTQLELSSGGQQQQQKLVGSRFCWAKMDVRRHLNKAFVNKNRRMSTRPPPLNVGICLPETCHTRSFQVYRKEIQRLVDSQFRLPDSIYIEDKLRVESIFCTVDKNSKMSMPNNGRVLLALLAGWMLMALVATIHRKQIARLVEEGDQRRLTAFLSCLDLKRSWLEFVGATKAAKASAEVRRRVELNALNPIKWAGCAFVIWGHSLLVRIGLSQDQFKLPNEMEERPFGGFVVFGTVVVDTFFAITGLIMSYMIMKAAARNAKASANAINNNKQVSNAEPNSQKSGALKFLMAVFQIIKTRYVRLLPLLIVFYWFKRSVFIYLGSGPFWDFGFNRETLNGACREESWLVPFTFTSAFNPLSKQCLMQSWSVSSDMFFVILFAPVMLIMTKKPKLAASIALAMCAVSLQALLRAISALDPADFKVVSGLTSVGIGMMFSRLSNIYSLPIYRINSFAIGMLAGYVLYKYDVSPSLKKWPSWFTGPLTKFSIFYMVGLFLVSSNGAFVKRQIDPYHGILFPYFMTLGKSIWALTNCVIFLRMMTDWNNSFWMRAASGTFWQCLSKINYAMLLSHFDLLIYDAVAVPQANLNDMWTIYQGFATVYTICVLLSTFVFVVIENPLDKLTRRLLFTSSNKVTTTDNSDNEMKHLRQPEMLTKTEEDLTLAC